MSVSTTGLGGRAAGVAAATAASLALAFVTSLVLARALGPSGWGTVAVLQTGAVIQAAVLGLGVPWALFHFSSTSREPQPELVGVSVRHAGMLAVAAIVLAVTVGPVLGDAQEVDDHRELYLIAAVLVPSAFLEYAYVDMLRAQRRLRLANRILVGSRLLAVAGAAVFVAALDLGTHGALLVLIAASASQWIAALPVVMAKGVAFSRAATRKVYEFGLRVQAASVSRLLSRRFDVLLLSLFAPTAVVGHYAVAQSLAELTLLAPQALGLTLGPLITGGEADRALTHRALRANATVALVAILGLAALSPWLLGFAFGEAFEPALTPLLILLPGVWMFACGELVSHVLAARSRPGAASWLSVMQAVATIALDLVLVPAYGIEGAAVASAVSYSLYGMASLALLARHDGVAPWSLLLATPGELRSLALHR